MAECNAGHVQKEVTTALRTSLLVNDVVIPLNPFIQKYIGNVIRAVVQSLDYPGRQVNVLIDRDDVRIFSDNTEVPIKKDFTRVLIESTIKGVLSPLKGIFWFERINIVTWDK